MLYRKIQPYIESYLKSDSNKVLIIDGARQIGKTFRSCSFVAIAIPITSVFIIPKYNEKSTIHVSIFT